MYTPESTIKENGRHLRCYLERGDARRSPSPRKKHLADGDPAHWPGGRRQEAMTAPTQSDTLRYNTSRPYHVSGLPAAGHRCAPQKHLSDEAAD